MYKVKCTGLNKNYGEKNEVRLIADHYLAHGLSNGWFHVLSYDGSGKPDTLYTMKRQLSNIDRDMKMLNLKKKLLKERLKKYKGE